MSCDVKPININELEVDLYFSVLGMQDRQKCGICEKPEEAKFFWANPISSCAHFKCLNIIEAPESDLWKTINQLFENEKGYYEKHRAHIRAIKAVKVACGSETILSYCEKNGSIALTKLFNTVGIEAAKEYEYARSKL